MSSKVPTAVQHHRRGTSPVRLVAAALAAGAALTAGVPATASAADRTPPSVQFTTPRATVAIAAASAKKRVTTCQATAKDKKGGVKRVDFFVAKKVKPSKRKLVWLGGRKKAPFRCAWNAKSAKPGTYTLFAKATDKSGNEGWDETDVKIRPSVPARPPVPAPTPPADDPAPAPGPGGPAAVGISASLRGATINEIGPTIKRLRDAGVQYSREDWEWNTVEESPGEYDWSTYDKLVRHSAEQGLQLVAIPDSPPDWATGGSGNPPTSGRALEAYIEFVRRSIERYGSNGTFFAENPDVPKVPVTMWNIWNEPYMPVFWGGKDPNGAEYARMFKAVVSAVDGVDPQAKFMAEAETGANTGRWPQPAFLGAMFKAVPDLGKYADVFSIHPYTSEVSPRKCQSESFSQGVDEFWQNASRFQFCRIKDVRKILDYYGAKNSRLWITEVGYTTAPSAERAVSEGQQAEYLRDIFAQLREWRIVDGVIWYHYKTNEGNSSDDQGYFGLVHEDGSPKPAWNAFVDEMRKGLPPAR
jgi:Bacterial Ig domain